MKKIYLSPSMQPANIYAGSEMSEEAVCREIAEETKRALERCGFEVVLPPIDGSLSARCAEADRKGIDLYIPIHTNAFNKSVSGTRMFCYSKSGEGYKACKSIFDVLAPLTPGTSENITERPGLFEVRTPKAPTAYIEVDFHDVPEVAKWIQDHTTDIGEAICKGVCVYFGADYKEPTTSEHSETLYKVQVGAFRNEANAEKLLKKLKTYGFSDAFIVKQ